MNRKKYDTTASLKKQAAFSVSAFFREQRPVDLAFRDAAVLRHLLHGFFSVEAGVQVALHMRFQGKCGKSLLLLCFQLFRVRAFDDDRVFAPRRFFFI